jgi:hypothetical protein
MHTVCPPVIAHQAVCDPDHERPAGLGFSSPKGLTNCEGVLTGGGGALCILPDRVGLIDLDFRLRSQRSRGYLRAICFVFFAAFLAAPFGVTLGASPAGQR